MKEPRWGHEVRSRTECRRRRAKVRHSPGERGRWRGWLKVLIWIARINNKGSENGRKETKDGPAMCFNRLHSARTDRNRRRSFARRVIGSGY